MEEGTINAQGLLVLILGDRPAEAEMLLEALRRAGFKPRATRVESESDFLASLDPWPDLILAEWASLPLDPSRALSLLSKRGVETAVILISSEADESSALAALKLGAYDVVAKEDLARLGPCVERALSESSLRREWRRLLSELTARKASLDAFFASSPAGMCIIDRQFRYLRINETLAAMNGPSVQEHLGRSIHEVIPRLAPSLVPILRQVFDSRRQLLNLEISGEVPSQPGIVRHWVVSYFPIQDASGEATTMGAVVVEITDRKQAEERLRESEETFRQLAENIGEVFWMTDPKSGQVVYVSPAYERIWGRSREELAASPTAWQQAIHPEDRARLLLKESTKLDEQGHDHVYRILHRDGSIRWIHDRTFPVMDSSGDVVRMAGIAQDITAQKQAEENVESLLRKVKETNDQLRRLSHQVVSSQEEERRRISRELHDQAGQALAALKILLKSIEQDMPPGLETQKARLGDALAVADATLGQIRNLAQGLRPPGLEQVGLNATLEGHCREFARQTRLAIDYHGVEVDVSDAVGICLYRVTQEALTNVVKHAEASDVKVDLRVDSRAITLSIEDDGRGISAGQRSGLGLVGMRERLELLGGGLDVERRESGGTRLTARVPRSSAT